MITVFVLREGYYVAGENMEAAFHCSPATDDRGNPIFHELHHTYKVMFLALQEVARKGMIRGDVVVYNDSRIIDELNGNIKPFDDICRKWQLAICRELIPHIRSVVLFRKKATDYIRSQIKIGESLLAPSDPVIMGALAYKIDEIEKDQARSLKARVLDRFKGMWKHEQQ